MSGSQQTPRGLGKEARKEPQVQPLPKDIDDLDVEMGSDKLKVPTPRVNPSHTERMHYYRESSATTIAIIILMLFALGLFFSFGFAVFIVAIMYKTPETILTNINNILEPLKVMAAIFTPLLAFVLGYYFGSSNKNDRDANK